MSNNNKELIDKLDDFLKEVWDENIKPIFNKILSNNEIFGDNSYNRLVFLSCICEIFIKISFNIIEKDYGEEETDKIFEKFIKKISKLKNDFK